MFSFLDRMIRYLFYSLFLLVPLTFWGSTSELFEFNKMWLTFIITILVGVAWVSKIILKKKMIWEKTIFDIPIFLFLLSQIISTIISIDPHVSLWGYYGRWNGGLLSIISYIFLYYAMVSNIEKKKEFGINILKISLISGLLVSLWGLPSHFGYDPTCFLFRGHLDVSCWTADFQPKIRIFSTLGQPDWLAAYLTILIPVSLYFSFNNFQAFLDRDKRLKTDYKPVVWGLVNLVLTSLFFMGVIFTQSKSGFLGSLIELIIFWALILFKNKKNQILLKLFSGFIILFGIILFLIGTPISQLNKFTLPELKNHFLATNHHSLTTNDQPPATSSAGELGGTDSGKIRLYVWQGAISAWLARPIFGWGVETFAFDYYMYRPAGHNLTSEWDYLYNKAHNEYLNYLATTGIFGLFTYLSIIILFLILLLKNIFIIPDKDQSPTTQKPLLIAICSSLIGILVTNFFGFSVVIVNLYFFLLPALFLFITSNNNQAKFDSPLQQSSAQIFGILVTFLIGIYLIVVLLNYWSADQDFAYGQNLDRVSLYTKAYPYLTSAVNKRPAEPTFQDELSVNEATLALLEVQNNNLSQASQFAQSATQISDQLTTEYPNNVVLWKSRVRIFYTLSEIDKKYLPYALSAVQKAALLAPTDAKISYNLGVLYAQNNDLKDSIVTLKNTIRLKPDYTDAYYALALVYRTSAVDKTGKKVINQENETMAVNYMKYILNHLNPNDSDVIKTLQNWGEL